MSDDVFTTNVLAIRKDLSAAAIDAIFEFLIENKFTFDDDKDFQFWIKHIRETPFFQLSHRIDVTADDAEDYISRKDDHDFIGLTDTSAVYVFIPQRKERW